MTLPQNHLEPLSGNRSISLFPSPEGRIFKGIFADPLEIIAKKFLIFKLKLVRSNLGLLRINIFYGSNLNPPVGGRNQAIC